MPGSRRDDDVAPVARMLWAASLKSLRVYTRYRFNAVMAFVNVIAWLPSLYFLGQSFGPNGRIAGLATYTGTGDYASFLIAGWVLASYLSAAFWGMGLSLFEEMVGGTLEANWLTPAPRWVIVVGQSMRTLVTTTISVVIVLVLARVLLHVHFNPGAWRAVWVLLPAVAGLYGVGFAAAALTLVIKDPAEIIDMLSYGTSVFSGDRFPVAALPEPLLVLSLAFPLTYAFDGLRHAAIGTASLVPFRIEVAIVIGFMVASALLSSAAFRLADRRVRRLGTLSHH
jgi:ABC-2 type transport system permease protein